MLNIIEIITSVEKKSEKQVCRNKDPTIPGKVEAPVVDSGKASGTAVVAVAEEARTVTVVAETAQTTRREDLVIPNPSFRGQPQS